MDCNRSSYNKFTALKTAIPQIFDYLFFNANDLWKLLRYTEPSEYPLLQDDLSAAEKAEMVINAPADYYKPDIVTKKNFLFQKYSDDAFDVAVPQVRMWIDDFKAINSYQGYANICFQIVVPNKQCQYLTGQTITGDRAVSLALSIIETLNGVEIPNSALHSPLFLDRQAPDGTGRNTGAFREKQNTQYNGYLLTFSVLL